MNSAKNKKRGLFSLKYFMYDFLRIILWFPGFLVWRPKYLYENEAACKKIKGGAVVISNHMGFMDPVYLMYGLWYRRLHIVALSVLFNTKIKNFFFRHFLCIPVDRENFNMSTFREIISVLKQNQIVAIFPEGKINFENKGLQTFKSGMVLMAMQSGKPVVPVFIEKKKGLFNRLVVVAGEPILIESKNSNLKMIENVTSEIYNKENILKKIAEDYRSKND